MKLTFNHVRAVTSSFSPRSHLHHVTKARRVSLDACQSSLARSHCAFATDRCRNGRSSTYSVCLSVSQHRAASRIETWRRTGSHESGHERWISHTTQRARQGKSSNDTDLSFGEGWTTETIDVPVGGNGTVEVNISTPIPTTTAAGEQIQQARNVLVYLPPGPFPESVTQSPDGDVTGHGFKEHEALLEVLAMVGRTQHSGEDILAPIVVRTNYRLSPLNDTNTSCPDHRYPLPIHDVSVAFEWVLEHITELCPTPARILQPDTHQIGHEQYYDGPKISLFGSHIGGSLALMLALTRPNDIHALVVRDPIVDWVGLDEVADLTLSDQSTKKRSRVDSDEVRFLTQKEANVLMNLRTRLFRNPSGFFDAFASPALFLRAPGRDTPSWRTARPEHVSNIRDEAYLAQLVKSGEGVHVNKFETDEVVSEMGYGPYDDDWHTAEHESNTQRNTYEAHGMPNMPSSSASDSQQLSTDLSTMSLCDGTIRSASQQHSTGSTKIPGAGSPRKTPDFVSPYEIGINSKAHSDSIVMQGSPIDQVLSEQDHDKRDIEPQPRRRKVLRRWPPIGPPEDTDLPWTRIYSTTPRSTPSTISRQTLQIGLSHVLHPQAKEMVDLMRRACFWGREKGLGEERVNLEIINPMSTEEGISDDVNDDSLLHKDDMEQEDVRSDTLLEIATWLKAISTVEK